MKYGCYKCVYLATPVDVEPCASCRRTNWEPKDPSLEPADIEPPKKSKKSKWRKYPDEKPENDATVIVYNGTYVLAADFAGDRFITGNGLVTLGVLVTHWRYMPKPPKEYRK